MAAADAQAGAAAEEQPQLAPEPQAATEPQPGLDLTADAHAESTAHIDTHSTAPALPQSPTGTHALSGAPSTQPAPLSPFALDAEVPAEAQTREDLPGAEESLSLVLDALGQGSTAEPTSTLNAPSTTAFESDLLSIAPHATDETTDLAAAHVQSEIELQTPRGEEHEQVSQYQLGPELDTTNTTPTLLTTTPTPVILAEPAITEEIQPSQEEAAALSVEAADPGLSLPQAPQPAEQQLPGELDGSPTPGADDDMSNPPHYPGMPGQHLGYVDQTGYATAAANSPYGYANPASQSPDAYQGSPTTPNHATSLPSIRAYDQVRPHPQHIQPQSHPPIPQYGTGVPQGVSPTAGSVGFYQQPAPLVSSSAYSSIAPDPMNPRYPLPPNEHSLLTSNRHKKEIKRRTKTGCLTCRKRRIKCDEQHPVCKNCQKSKRQCLGYDPIFKQQPLHPTTIQPALNHTAHSPNGAYSATSASPVATTYTGMAATPVEVKKMNVDELVSMGGATVPSLDSPLTQERIDEIRELYEQVYALGLEAFFESKWFTGPQAVQALASNTAISEMLAGFLQCVSNSDANDATSMQLSANLEFRVVWDLACLVCSAPAAAAGTASSTLVPDDATETRHRVTVLAALLSGDFLYSNPLTAPPPVGDSFRLRELTFWHCIAEFLCIRDDGASDRTGRREQVLSRTRDVLDGRENRDVIYSFAVIRALSPGQAPNFENYLPPHLNEADPKSRLAVARKFIQDEAQVTGGTTNVVRRFAELAVRAFIVPGSNIQR